MGCCGASYVAASVGGFRVLTMGYQGLIFGAVAACWLIYLVPMLLSRRDHGITDEIEPGEPFSASVTIVRRGTPLDTAENGIAVVSTPFNRRAALRELADLDRSAARRRRAVVLLLLLIASATTVLAGFSLVPWWTLAVPGGLLAAFLVVARFSVARMRRKLDARARVIRGGDVDEETVAIELWEASEEDEAAHSVELSGPIEVTGSLWDPIPITTPTYVSRPLAPRTVRTIDLSAPIASGSSVPVTADAPDERLDSDQSSASAADAPRPWAAGE